MKQLLSHLIRGQKTGAARVSMDIHERFVLKQQLSKKELKKRQDLLPEEFVKLDRIFHKQARQLSDAAKAGNFDRAMSIYNNMTAGCVTCHARFAGNRFPALENKDRGD